MRDSRTPLLEQRTLPPGLSVAFAFASTSVRTMESPLPSIGSTCAITRIHTSYVSAVDTPIVFPQSKK